MPTNVTHGTDLDQELIDVLTAISIITRLLAKKISASNKPKEDKQNV